jgi:hypothetical protein
MLLKPKTEVKFTILYREIIDDEMKFDMHFRTPNQEFTIFPSKVQCNLATASHIKNLFIVTKDLVFFTTCFGELGHLYILHTMYEIPARKLSHIK